MYIYIYIYLYIYIYYIYILICKEVFLEKAMGETSNKMVGL